MLRHLPSAFPPKKAPNWIVRGINNGELPAPYNNSGLAGRQIELLVYDEAGGGTKQVTELRNKVQKDNVDAIIGIISSGTCAALTKVAEELKVLTIQTVCGTPRVFEEIQQGSEIRLPDYQSRNRQQRLGGALSCGQDEGQG